MAEKLTIEIFRRKDAEELSAALADPESRTAVGSGAAMTAAIAAAWLHRAAMLCVGEDERLAWLRRNSETLRIYMVRLIDEDVNCRGPLRRALREGDAHAIEAAYQPAVAIAQEIVNMMGQALELLEETAARTSTEGKTYCAAGAELALSAIKASMRYILDMSAASSDETYRFVIRRENEITLEQAAAACERVLKLSCNRTA